MLIIGGHFVLFWRPWVSAVWTKAPKDECPNCLVKHPGFVFVLQHYFESWALKSVDGLARLLQFAMKRLLSPFSLALEETAPWRYFLVVVGSVLVPFPSMSSMSFKLGNAGWYWVTKGRIFFRAVLFLFWSDVFLSENSTSERCFSAVAAG